MSKFKPHIALLVCNILWAMDYPFYNIVLPEYVHPMAMVSGSLIATALLSLIPLAWEKSEKVARTDIRRLIGAALLIGVLRKVFIMYGLSMTSPIDGSIIDTIVPLLVLVVSVLLGMDRFTKLKVAGLALGMAGAVAVVLTGISAAHTHSHLWGNILILLCACVTSLYMVWFKRLIAKYRITTVLRWLYCVAAGAALPFGLKEIVHTAGDHPHRLRRNRATCALPDPVRADRPDLSAQPDAQLCAEERARDGVEHIHLFAARTGDRHFGGHGT